MSQQKTYHKIIDQIFDELINESSILIEYKGYPSATDDESDVRDFRILSVNGYRSPKLFADRMTNLCNKFLSDVNKTYHTLPPTEKTSFMDEVMERLAPLLEVVVFESFHTDHYFLKSDLYDTYCRNNDLDESDPEKFNSFSGVYIFQMAGFKGDKYHEAPYYFIDRILLSAYKYAFFWEDAISNVQYKLTMLSTMVEFLPIQPPPVITTKTNIKIRLKTNVPQSACVLRFLIDNEFFDTRNKSDIFRGCVEIFQSKGTDSISANNLKNHADSPSLEDIMFCEEMFTSMASYARKLKKRYYPNC